jgi:hypothetical protein
MDPYKDPTWILCVHSWSKMLIFHLKYVQMCQGESGGAAVDLCKDLTWLQGSYMDPMWGRSGPSMDPCKDPT